MTSLRVALIGPYPPPFGGIASHLVSLIPGLRQRGVEDVVVVTFGAKDEVVHEGGATIHRVRLRERFRQAALHPMSLAANVGRLLHWNLPFRRLLHEAVRAHVIDAVVRQHGSNVVSFYQSDDSIPLAALRPEWRRNRGIVLTVFGEVFDHAAFLSPRRGALGRLLSSADTLLSSSKHCARSFSQLGIQNSIEPVYYGVELDRFDSRGSEALRRRYGIASDAVVALFMGRFTAAMGIESVLDAAPELLRLVPKLVLLLAGAKGPFDEQAAQFVADSPGRVIVEHDVPFSAQPALYGAADIVLAPTRDQHACMGMSIKEAMASARATVGTDAGGIPEAIIHDVTGLLVPLAANGAVNPSQFVKAVALLANDRGRREAMGRAARARAEEIFSAERTIDRIHDVFRSVAP